MVLNIQKSPFLAQWLFRHGVKFLQVKFKAKTILTLTLSVIWWNHLILEGGKTMKNGLITSVRGQHREALACQGSWIWERSQSQAGLWVQSLGLPVQTAEEAPACPWLLLEETARPLRNILGGKGKPHSVQTYVCREQPFQTPVEGLSCVSHLLALGEKETE